MTELTTRDRLLAAAWTIIQTEGPAAATSRHITEVAEANLAAITYHFGSKDELLGRSVTEQLQRWTAPLSAALADATGGIADQDARVAAAIDALIRQFAAAPDEVQPIITLLSSYPDLPGIRDAVIDWLTQLRAVATDVMTRQQAAGQVPSSVDPPVMAAVFTAFALGLAAQANLDPGAPPAPSVIGQFLSLLVRPG